MCLSDVFISVGAATGINLIVAFSLATLNVAMSCTTRDMDKTSPSLFSINKPLFTLCGEQIKKNKVDPAQVEQSV